MHIHILGVGGSFMGGLAVLARELGHDVTGSDSKVYPPMSTQLAERGIELFDGYGPANLKRTPDLVVIGNALSRGNPEVEAVLDRGLPYTSGAQWLAEHVLARRWVLAIAGTHGKTTTTSLLAWILESAGLAPGFLIGGVPENFGVSARLGSSAFFVVEADEYDTAFFDKRSKFVHYRPRTAVLNNLEYDHADIFPDLEAIKLQFHHLIRTVPGNGLLIINGADPNLQATLDLGTWTPVERFNVPQGWNARLLQGDGGRFQLRFAEAELGVASWPLMGMHNVLNAQAAIAAARHAGVPPQVALEALAGFRNVRRRLEVRGTAMGVTVYDDFAHHPTAIAATIGALRAHIGSQRLIAVLEARSNTMRLGVHRSQLAPALDAADRVLLYQSADLKWDLQTVAAELNRHRPPQGGAGDSGTRARVFGSTEDIVTVLAGELQPEDHVLVMSNGSFDNLHQRLLDRLRQVGK
ncbi:MAG: UDP-N-acetylmuramate:L-alanyl-gamma-D-glutamyl-meso-diaminopimelate ligase [Gammaproteobacteria bacterium]|nr:UDP-N-acetylmuramate:L-alanyl-gamma-D-glutamyl-meso-diaminopimelate ligase [Gammaproteobacteria bacterium]